MGELDAGDAGPEVGQEHVQRVGQPGVVAGHGGADQHLEVGQAGPGRDQAHEAAVLALDGGDRSAGQRARKPM